VVEGTGNLLEARGRGHHSAPPPHSSPSPPGRRRRRRRRRRRDGVLCRGDRGSPPVMVE